MNLPEKRKREHDSWTTGPQWTKTKEQKGTMGKKQRHTDTQETEVMNKA